MIEKSIVNQTGKTLSVGLYYLIEAIAAEELSMEAIRICW